MSITLLVEEKPIRTAANTRAKKGIIMITRYFMNRKINTFAVLGIVTAFLLVACGGSTTPTATAASAILKHLPSGTADLSWDPSSKMLTVKLSLLGLAPSSIHPAHIHVGSCENQGKVLYPLKAIVADAHGVAMATTMIPNVATGIPATGWYVNVHNGPGVGTGAPTDPQFLPIVCGNVANASTSTTAAQSVNVAMIAAPPASAFGSQAAKGMAQLTLSGTTLTVKLTLSGLAPNTMHAAHIHAGSCESQGAVMFPLTTVVADGSGNASVTTTVPNVSAISSKGWYVNVHRTTALSTSTGFDPIACGNVAVG